MFGFRFRIPSLTARRRTEPYPRPSPVPNPPEGHVLLVDNAGKYLVDNSGNFLTVRAIDG